MVLQRYSMGMLLLLQHEYHVAVLGWSTVGRTLYLQLVLYVLLCLLHVLTAAAVYSCTALLNLAHTR